MRGSVTKKDGRYFIVYTVGTRTAKTGLRAGQLVPKQKWEKVPEPNTKKNAEKLLAMRVSEIARGVYQEIKKDTFSEFAERWLRDYAGDTNHVKQSTGAHYVRIFKAQLLPFFGSRRLTDITPELVQEFITLQSQEGKLPQTVRNYLTPLGKMLKHAVQWGYLRTSPMPYVQLPRVRRKEMAFLTGDQARALLEKVPEEWRPLFLVGVMTGMRLGELLAMRWKNLDWKAAAYHVRERLYNCVFDTPKTETSARTVDLSAAVLSALKAHRASQSALKLRHGADYKDQDLVFSLEDGRPIVAEHFLRLMMGEALDELELPRIRFHDLRHTCAALLIDQGASPKYIQRQLGHRSIQTTLDTYGHLMPDAGQEIMRKLDEQVFGKAQ